MQRVWRRATTSTTPSSSTETAAASQSQFFNTVAIHWSSGGKMLHSLNLAPSFQSANAHSWIAGETNDATIEGAARDKVDFQNGLTALPLVTFQAGETVIASGSKTGRLLILRKGTVAILKENTEIARAGRNLRRTLVLAGSAAHSGRARGGNLAAARSERDYAVVPISDRVSLCCHGAGEPARCGQPHPSSTSEPSSGRPAAQRGCRDGEQNGRTSRRQRRKPALCRIPVRSLCVMSAHEPTLR